MFASIKNGQIAKKSSISHPSKKICEAFLKILWTEGYILGYTVEKQNLKIFLKFTKGKPALVSLKLITKPSKRVYYSAKQIWKLNSNQNCIIISTSKGLKTLNECKKQKIGGELFLVLK